MSSEKTKGNRTASDTPAATGELSDDELELVSGGTALPAAPLELTSEPTAARDAASGLPTGKRMHKPFQ